MTWEEQLQRESEVYAWTADQFDIQLAFKKGAEWERKRLVEKACEWLRRNYTNYMINDLSKYVEDVCSFDVFDDLLVDDFRKAMEE